VTKSTALLERCVTEYYMSAGHSPARMADVLRYLSGELLRDAFYSEQTNISGLVLDASGLRDRLLSAAESVEAVKV
jgi:hypothetical protein